MIWPVLPITLGISSLFSPESTSELERLLYERTRAMAVHETCSLFTDEQTEALARAIERIELELLRAGTSKSSIDDYTSRIRTDRSLAECDSEEVRTISARYQAAYSNYLQSPSHQFDGRFQSWTADRTTFDFVRWNLFQNIDGARFGQARLSLEEDAPFHVAFAWRGPVQPAMATLVMRDMDEESEPWDNTLGGFLPLPAGKPIARFGPPDHAQTRILASSRTRHAQTDGLLPGLMGDPDQPVRVIAFPDTLIDKLAVFDPKESVRLDLHAPGGELIGQYWIEIGPLRDAVDFLALEFQGAG